MKRFLWPLWLLACALFVLVPPLMWAAPRLEGSFDPPRINNANLDPVRTPDRVCWVWSSDKLRLPFSDDVDIHLDLLDPTGAARNTYVPPLYNALTGMPWQSALPIGLGHHEIPYCIDLPRTIRREDRLRVRFTPMVHGWLDLWPLPIWTPDIVDPREAQAPL